MADLAVAGQGLDRHTATPKKTFRRRNLWLTGAFSAYRRIVSQGGRGVPCDAACAKIAAQMAIILAVEDDLFLLNTLEWIIENLGHSALLASNLAEARVHLAAPCQIDMLFVDIRLKASVDGGYDIADKAIALRPGLPILYTSGSFLTDDMTGRFVPGGRFLQKPYDPAQLAASISGLVD